jgi:hypothetical protein
MQGRKQDTALVWAARLGDFVEVKRLLLTTNANEWEVNGRKENAMQVAAFKGHLRIVQWLVRFCGADDYTHASILPHAILGRQARVVEWCLGYSKQFALYNAQEINALDAIAMTPDARNLESLYLAGAVFDESHLVLALAHDNEPFLLKMMNVMPFPFIVTMVRRAKNSRVLRKFLELYPPCDISECPLFVQELAIGQKWLLENIKGLHNHISKRISYAIETGKVNIVKTAIEKQPPIAYNSGYCLLLALRKRAWNLARWLIHKYCISQVWRGFFAGCVESLIRGNQVSLLRWFVEELTGVWDFALLKHAFFHRECFLYLWTHRGRAINSDYNLLMDAVKLNQIWFFTRYFVCFDKQQQWSCFCHAIDTNNVAFVLVFVHMLGASSLASSIVERVIIHDHVHLLRWFYPCVISININLLQLACELGATKCATWLFCHVDKEAHAAAIHLAIRHYRPAVLDWIIANRFATKELLRFVVAGQQLTWLQKIIQLQPDLTQRTLDWIFNDIRSCAAKECMQVPILEQMWSFHFDKGRALEAAYFHGEVDSVRWLLQRRAHESCLIDAVGCSPDLVRVFLHHECFAFFPHSAERASKEWLSSFDRITDKYVRKVYLARFIMDKNVQKIITSY